LGWQWHLIAEVVKESLHGSFSHHSEDCSAPAHEFLFNSVSAMADPSATAWALSVSVMVPIG
jgi:hypothetical protein